MSYFKIYDPATGALVMDENSAVFRVVGRQFVVGAIDGNPWIDGSSGSITNAALATGTPYCWAIWNGTANGGAPSSADPPAPNMQLYGDTITFSNLWGDWWFIYGVA